MDDPVREFAIAHVPSLSSAGISQITEIRTVIRSIVEPKRAREILANIDRYFTPTANSQ